METLKVGMKHTQEWVVEEKHTTQRGDYRVFSTPSMTQLVESTANQLAAPHLKPGQGQVGEAEHDRFVIDLDKYYEKLRKKF